MKQATSTSLLTFAVLTTASAALGKVDLGKPDLRCGGYCLYVALRTLDFPVANFQAIESRLGQPSPLGYSMDQLAAAARSFGAHVAGVETTLEDLPRHVGKFACIALLDKGHFVNIADVDDGRVLVIDPPRHRTVAAGALKPLWGGKVLLVSHQPLALAPASLWDRGRALRVGGSILVGVLVLAAIMPVLVRRVTRRTLVALLVASSLVACDRAEPPRVKIPSIAVTPTVVELGSGVVGGGRRLRSHLTVRNRGTTTLHVASVRSSCGCTVLSTPRKTLAPDQEDRIEVVVDVGVKAGPRDSIIVIESDDPARSSLRVPVRWEAEAQMTIRPDELDLGKLPPGRSAERRIVVRRLGPGPTPTMKLDGSGPGLSAAWDGPPGSERGLLVRVVAGREAGEQTGSVTLSGDDSQLASIVPVRWRVGSALRASPASLFSSDVTSGGVVEARWVVMTDEDRPFRIRSVTFAGDDLADGFTWDRKAALRHELRAKVAAPPRAGVVRKVVRVETDLESTPHFEIPWSMVVR